MCLLEIIHWITLCLYAVVIGKSALLLPYVKDCHKIKNLKLLIYGYLISLLSMSVVFSILQINWIVDNHDNVVGTKQAYMWAFYDVANAFVQMFYLFGLEVYLKWKCLDRFGGICKRRRKDDP